jgi:hypothetical protein
MATGLHKTIDTRVSEKEREPAGSQPGSGKDDDCRCKEASKLSPRELLGLMLSDLAFWKKPDKG